MIVHLCDYRDEDEAAYRSSEIKPHLDMLVHELTAAGKYAGVCNSILADATQDV